MWPPGCNEVPNNRGWLPRLVAQVPLDRTGASSPNAPHFHREISGVSPTCPSLPQSRFENPAARLLPVASRVGYRGATFFSRQVQKLQFPTHHAWAHHPVFGFLDPLAQLAERSIRSLFDFGSNQALGTLQGPFGTMVEGQSRTTARVSPAVPPLFQRRFMDTELRGHLRLGLSSFQGGDRSFT